MSRLHDLTTMSTDQRRIELAKLLATGLVRLLLQRQRVSSDDGDNTDETLADGLEDS
ncbi:MAG: hypothetical protein NTW52_20250 [Planctomycetota bacterium]|nr:hypothetical protein [Planctomycetota bacterium]